ncbi:MAG TPA: hypothetical protein VHO25_04580, partial [Polyangiaceae bacterium]|nr:hypothetical protein [Polyangiaceae bacterium]
MGRRAEGWKLRTRGKGRHFTVRFWIGGREIERSTGTSDGQRAAKEASRIYAAEVGRAENRPKRRSVSGHTLEELLALWLEALKSTHAAGTVATWKMYGYAHWAPHFDAPHHINDLMCVEYMRARLLVVQGETVRKELTALRQFISWCAQVGFMPAGVKVPSVPKRSLGTVFADKPKRKAAIEITPAEVEEIIALLPQWSTSRKVKRFPIRARFVVAYDTSLRPSTLDKLLKPVHF